MDMKGSWRIGLISLAITLVNACSNSALPPDATMARVEVCDSEAELQARIEGLQEELDQLRLRYTEQHPEVVRTRRSIEELERTALERCVEAIQ